MSKLEKYKMYYASDVFNTNFNGIQKEDLQKKKTRKIHPIQENTKESIFNIGKQKRIKRQINKNNEIKNKSFEKRKNKNDESDIFMKRTNSFEKRKGVKYMPNILNKKTVLYETRDIDEYVKELKNYQEQHRNNNDNYNPEKYINKITPNERYFKTYYDDNVLINNEDYKTQKQQELKKYIHDRKYLKNEINKLNDSFGERRLSQEKRFNKQSRNKSEERRYFADSKDFPKYNCSINKQIQMESHIFNNQDNQKNYFEEAKAINQRLELAHKRQRRANILQQPYKTMIKSRNNVNLNNSKNEYNNMTYTQRKKYIDQINNNENLDLITGIEKIPKISKIYKNRKEKENKKIEEIIESIPNLSNRNKIQIKMKASVLDCNNDKEWEKKGKEYNDFYRNNLNKISKKQEVTGKIGDKNDNYNTYINKKININEKPSEKYIMAYSSKGQFNKFNKDEIKDIFGQKGIQAYDIDCNNSSNDGYYNTISMKLKGNNNKDKIHSIESDLKKEKYKIKIKQGDINKTINNEKINKLSNEKRFKMIPKVNLNRKGKF